MIHTTYKISLTGLNLHKAIDYFQNQNFHLSEIEKINQKQVIFNISKNDFLIFKKNPISKNYKIKILHKYGLDGFIKKVLSKIGLFSAIIIMALSTINLSSKITSISITQEEHVCQNNQNCIYSSENISKVKLALKELGLEENKKLSSIPKNKKIHDELINQFPQISEVSISRKGTHIFVSILEAKLPTNKNKKDLIATENGVVIETQISSGKLMVKNGDIVMKGDTLIKYDGNPISGKITLRTFYNESTIFNEINEYYLPTGNKMHLNEISLFKLIIKNKIKRNFRYYKSEISHQYLSLNMIIPIKIKQTTFYELKKVEIIQDFEDKKDEVYSSLESSLKNKIPTNTKIINTFFTVKKENKKYLINCYIETYLNLKI